MATKSVKKSNKKGAKRGITKRRLISIIIVAIVTSFVLYKVVFSVSSATYVTSAFRQSDPLVELCPSAEESLENTTIHEFPLVNKLQQKRLSAIPALSKNLVANPTFEIDPATNAPADFNHNDDSSHSAYIRELDADIPYLRSANLINVPASDTGAGWVMSPVNLISGESYRYSVTYRSSVEVTITLDSIKDGAHTYTDIAKLPANSKWSTFHGLLDSGQSDSLRIITSSREKGTIDISEYNIVRVPNSQLANGMVSITFDDGWKSVYETARPILKEYGFKTTQYIISDIVQSDQPAYMNVGQVTALQNDGHEIGSHSLQHCDMAQLSPSSMRHFSDTSYSFLSSKWKNITSFAYPFGSYSEKSQEVFSTNYQYVRSTDGGLNDRYFDRQYIKAYTIHKSMTMEEFNSLLKQASEQKKWLVLVYHGVDTTSNYDVTEQQLRQQFDSIKMSGLTVKSLTEAADSIKAN